MTGDKTDNERAGYRKRRVKRIKRIIITLCIILLVLPTILSVFLMVKVSSLQRQINDIVTETVSGQEESGEEQDVVETIMTDSVSHSAVASTEGAIATVVAVASQNAISESEGTTTAKKVYLTFDDGPGTQTEKILDILKKQKTKATFFVTGKEDEFSRKLYKKIVDEGHTLGMHSYSHNYENIYKSEKAFAADFEKIFDLLSDVTGVEPRWYRFPGGSSTETMKPSLKDLAEVLDEKGVSYIDWNVISPEAMNPKVSKRDMIDSILSDVEKYDVAVVMLYDAADRTMSVKALPSLIKKMKEKNYQLLPLEEDTTLIRHNEFN